MPYVVAILLLFLYYYTFFNTYGERMFKKDPCAVEVIDGDTVKAKKQVLDPLFY